MAETIIVRCSNEGCGNTWEENAAERRRLSRDLANMARECGALPEGEFRLSSGAQSRAYLDGITLGLYGPASLAIGHALSREAGRARVDLVAGPALGAAPMVAAATAHRAGEPGSRPLRGALIRGEWKNHGIPGLVAGRIHNRDRVMLVDDVITTGGSMEDAHQIIEEEGGIILHRVVLLDRREQPEPGTTSLIDRADLWGGERGGMDPWWGSKPCGQCVAEAMIFTDRPTIPEVREEMLEGIGTMAEGEAPDPGGSAGLTTEG